jgi:hypothetical protein
MRIVIIGFASCLLLAFLASVITKFGGSAGSSAVTDSPSRDETAAELNVRTEGEAVVPANWKASLIEDAGAACKFPSEPTVYVDQLAEIRKWTDARGERILLMNWFKAAKPPQLSVEAMFDGMERVSLGAFPGAQVMASTNFQFAGRHPAREVIVRIPNVGLYHMKLIWRRDRVCTISATGPTEFVEGPDAAAFFKSFHFIDDGP